MKTESGVKNRLFFLLLCICLVAIFIHAVKFNNKKEGYFVDEALSFRLANNNITNFSELVEAIKGRSFEELENKRLRLENDMSSWHTYEEVMEKYKVLDDDRFSYVNPYILQAQDVHPPLYYYVIKTVCSIFPKMEFKPVGFGINIVFAILTCILIYKIGMLLLDNSLCAIASVLYYGFSYAFVNSVTYYRMYVMLTFWMALMVYMSMQWFKKGYPDEKKEILKLCVVQYLAMMTQYFAVFFCLPIFVLNICLMKINKKKIGKYIGFNVATGVLYFVSWPFAIMHMLFTDRGGDVAGNLTGMHFISNLMRYNWVLRRSMFSNGKKVMIIFCLFAAVVLVIGLVRKIRSVSLSDYIKTEHFGMILYVVVTSAFYYCVAAILSPWTSDRYIAPAIPMFCLIIMCVWCEGFSLVIKNKNIISIFLFAFVLFIGVKMDLKMTPEYLYNTPQRREFKENYLEYDAVVIDGSSFLLSYEIEMNFEHPHFLELRNDKLDILDDNLEKDKTYVLYIRKEIDVSDVRNELDKMGISTSDTGFETDNYRVFRIN